MSRETGISFIQKEDIPVKGADCSPMDFFGFGWLKAKVAQRKVRTLAGLAKVVKEEWSKLSPETIQNVYAGWKRRLRMIDKMQGKHVEQVKGIHSKRTNSYQ